MKCWPAGTPSASESVQGTVHGVLNRAPEPVERLRSGLPPALVRIVNRALAKDAVRRYQQAEQMLADLQACRQQLQASPARVESERRVPSIAVLPFANLSADKEQEYFCDGMTEELITALSALPGLRVAAHSSSFQFKGQALDIRKVGEQLNVETVLEGSVRKLGERLRVAAQLVNVSDGYHLWSERYDRRLDDVFEVQDEIARAIVEKLKVKLIGEPEAPLVKRGTANMEAYQLYLQGRYYFARRYKGGLGEAVDCFSRAVAIDPDFALAWAGLGGFLRDHVLVSRTGRYASYTRKQWKRPGAPSRSTRGSPRRTTRWQWRTSGFGVELDRHRARVHAGLGAQPECRIDARVLRARAGRDGARRRCRTRG